MSGGGKKRNNSRISGNKTFVVFINVYLAESTAKKESRGKFFRFFPRARQKKKKKANTKKVSSRGRTMRCPFCLSGKANVSPVFWLFFGCCLFGFRCLFFLLRASLCRFRVLSTIILLLKRILCVGVCCWICLSTFYLLTGVKFCLPCLADPPPPVRCLFVICRAGNLAALLAANNCARRRQQKRLA